MGYWGGLVGESGSLVDVSVGGFVDVSVGGIVDVSVGGNRIVTK